MGDSCFNDGMQHIAAHTGDLLGGVYSTCIATGKDQNEDTTNGYFLNMNANVDLFAEGVRADPNLKNGFSAIGFSQGNAIIRGYIAKYNDPPVKTFISVNGVNAGIGAVPYCRPKFEADEQDETDSSDLSFSMCDLLMEAASKRFYTSYMQEHSFQANYWRDPRPSAQEAYKTYAQLADWNNEAHDVNATYNENWAKTERFVWVMAEQDQMVWPKEGEHWGAPDPNDPFNSVLPMKQTEWYQKDLFGLRTADEAGKNAFESFDGDHLQFTMEEFDGWVTKYMA
jgi:palmitoyl-protein thioesterase